jgi:hypothetical protein
MLVKIPQGAEAFRVRMPMNAFIVDSLGTMSERTFIYDPTSEGFEVDVAIGGHNVSLFFPSFDMGFLWWKGHWIDYAGDYWENSQWMNVQKNNWASMWHTYWYGWDGIWHRYWLAHHNDPHWPYQKNETWPSKSGPSTQARLQPPKSPIWGKNPTRSSEGYVKETPP